MTRNLFSIGMTSIASAICLFAMPITTAHAQASFIYNNGYGETIDPQTGLVSGGTQYTYSSQVQNPYLTYSGSTTPHITYGRKVTEGTTVGSDGRVYSEFDVAQNSTISMNVLSLDLFVTDPTQTNGMPLYDPTTQDPFMSAHIAVYNIDPNTPPTSAALATHLVGGDDTFTMNYLDTAATSFTGNYRYAATSAQGNGPTDTSMPIYNVGLNLNSLTLGTGQYFFVISVDVNQAVAPGQLAYAVIADANDAVNGQPFTATNGQNGIYSVSSQAYLTDQPQYNGSSNPIILDAFPYTLTGTVNDTMAEPGALALVVLGCLPSGAGLFIKKRFQKRVG